MIQKTDSTPAGTNHADSRNSRGSRVSAVLTIEREGTDMTTQILTPARLKQLSALQGTRGVIGSLVSKACLLTNGTYYVDVVGENPSLVEAVNRSNELTYGDDDGNFSLAKLHNAVKSTIDRKRKDSLATAAENGATSSFPNVEAIRDDDAGTVYIVNWNNAPDDDNDVDEAGRSADLQT